MERTRNRRDQHPGAQDKKSIPDYFKAGSDIKSHLQSSHQQRYDTGTSVPIRRCGLMVCHGLLKKRRQHGEARGKIRLHCHKRRIHQGISKLPKVSGLKVLQKPFITTFVWWLEG